MNAHSDFVVMDPDPIRRVELALEDLRRHYHQIVYATPPPIHTYRDDLPEELEDAVAQVMLKDPDKRIASGAAMAAELTILTTGYPSDDLRADAARVGIAEFLEKPFEIEILGVRRPALRIDRPLFDPDGDRMRG